MTQLFEAMNRTDRTMNGAVTHHSSLSPLVDLFFALGASRGRNIDQLFRNALVHDTELALRMGLYMRDIRGGAGERAQFKRFLDVARTMVEPYVLLRIIPKIPEVGRYTDLKAFWDTPYQDIAASIWVDAINEGNALAAKWAPRKDKKGAKPLRKLASMTEQQWRKFVVAKSDTVEQKLCANEGDSINWNHVPSKAMSKYLTHFHSYPSFLDWKKKLEKGDSTVKVNAGAIYPYELIKTASNAVSQAQWDALPNYLGESKERMLPVIDVSGSMLSKVPNQSASCMDVAISLGIYIAERNEGTFKNLCMSFSERPRMFQLSGSLDNKVNQVKHSGNVGYSTSLDAVFTTLLHAAVTARVPESEMPTKLFIVSDMEFNSAFSRGYSVTAFEHAADAYQRAGYKLPQIVFWKVNSLSKGSVPVTIGTAGTALVSGFSPAIMKSLLADELNPELVMLKAILDERYAF